MSPQSFRFTVKPLMVILDETSCHAITSDGAETTYEVGNLYEGHHRKLADFREGFAEVAEIFLQRFSILHWSVAEV